MFFYLYLGRRAWRIDQELRRLAAGSGQSIAIPWLRRSIGVLAWCGAIGYAAIILVWEVGVVAKQIVDRSALARIRAQPPSEDMMVAFFDGILPTWRLAIARGVQRVFYGSKFHKDASVLFEYLGLKEVERYYSAWWGA